MTPMQHTANPGHTPKRAETRSQNPNSLPHAAAGGCKGDVAKVITLQALPGYGVPEVLRPPVPCWYGRYPHCYEIPGCGLTAPTQAAAVRCQARRCGLERRFARVRPGRRVPTCRSVRRL